MDPCYYISAGISRYCYEGLSRQREKSMIEMQAFEEITQNRMGREIRLSGSEGGRTEFNRPSLPLSSL